MPSRGEYGLDIPRQDAEVLPAAIVWGVGTALGELPPYFVTRAAKRAGNRAGEFEEELEDAEGKTDFVSRLKMLTIDFTKKHGFVGVYLLASWPNAAFDMCGMACGWLDMPLWTFLGATVLGKGLTKVAIQCAICIVTFSKIFFDNIMCIVDKLDFAGWGISDLARSVRSKVMGHFELQERLTAKGLRTLMKQEGLLVPSVLTLDQTSLAQKYCAMGSPPLCGEIVNGSGRSAHWKKTDEWARALDKAQRVLAHLDTDGDGALGVAELEMAQSRTDGKLSLASIDPGEGGLFSLGNLWNGFLALLILFFIVKIVEQVAKVQQNEKDVEELEELKISLNTNAKKAI